MSSDKEKLLGDAPPDYSNDYIFSHGSNNNIHINITTPTTTPYSPYQTTNLPTATITTTHTTSHTTTQPSTPYHNAIDIQQDLSAPPEHSIYNNNNNNNFDYEDNLKKDTSTVTKSALPEYTEMAAPLPNTPYHPAYYDTIITTSIAQVSPNDLNHIQQYHVDPQTYPQPTCGETFRRFPCLTCLHVFTWTYFLFVGFVVLGYHLAGQEGESFEPRTLLPLIPAYLGYALHLLLWTIPAGCIPLVWRWWGRTEWKSDEYVVETLRVVDGEVNCNQRAAENLAEITQIYQPVLKLHVSTYHTVQRTRQVSTRKDMNFSDEQEYKTETYTEQIFSYKGTRRIPILRHRDVSTPPSDLHELLKADPDFLVLKYSYNFELPTQHRQLLDDLRKQYYYEHCYRDDHCDVTMEYTIEKVDENNNYDNNNNHYDNNSNNYNNNNTHTTTSTTTTTTTAAQTHPPPERDVIMKEPNFGFTLRHNLFYKPIPFFLWSYLLLSLVPVMVFQTSHRLVSFECVKHLHLGKPDKNNDICVLNEPSEKRGAPPEWAWWK